MTLTIDHFLIEPLLEICEVSWVVFKYLNYLFGYLRNITVFIQIKQIKLSELRVLHQFSRWLGLLLRGKVPQIFERSSRGSVGNSSFMENFLTG